MNRIRKSLIASAVGMALAGSAQAGIVLFDVNGAAGSNTSVAGPGRDRFAINLFDWIPGNLLIRDTVPIGAIAVDGAGDPLPVPLYSQSLLGTLSGPSASFSYDNAGGGGLTGQLTYQLRQWVTPAANGADIQYSNATGPTTSILEIYYNSTLVANDVTGCGYGNNQTIGAAKCGLETSLGSGTSFPGTLILRGTATLISTPKLTDDGVDAGGLDQFASGSPPDSDSGITTNGLGLQTATINVNVTTFDPTFFLTNIDSLAVDLQHTEQGGGSPFKQANPSDEVYGNELQRTGAQVTAAYGPGPRNDFVCSGGGTNCDIHLQSDASTTVLTSPIPEPGSLALLGLGLAFVGVGIRRRSRLNLAG